MKQKVINYYPCSSPGWIKRIFTHNIFNNEDNMVTYDNIYFIYILHILLEKRKKNAFSPRSIRRRMVVNEICTYYKPTGIFNRFQIKS